MPISDMYSNFEYCDLPITPTERAKASEGIVNSKPKESDYALLLSEDIVESLDLFYEEFKEICGLRV